MRKTGFSRVGNYCKTAFLRVFHCLYLQSNPKEGRGMRKLKKMLNELFKLDRRVKCSLVQVSGEDWVWVFIYQRRFMHTRFKHNVRAIGQEGQCRQWTQLNPHLPSDCKRKNTWFSKSATLSSFSSVKG